MFGDVEACRFLLLGDAQAAEREVHGAFVIPGMAEPARPVAVEQESSTDDDGFF